MHMHKAFYLDTLFYKEMPVSWINHSFESAKLKCLWALGQFAHASFPFGY